jgi:quinol monooxygenase YgiN
MKVIITNQCHSLIRRAVMVNVALLVRLKVKPGKEEEVTEFLKGGLKLVEAEHKTTAWFALRMDQSTFGIFDAFPDESGKQEHLAGKVATALKEKSADLFTEIDIAEVDVLAAKLP